MRLALPHVPIYRIICRLWQGRSICRLRSRNRGSSRICALCMCRVRWGWHQCSRMLWIGMCSCSTKIGLLAFGIGRLHSAKLREKWKRAYGILRLLLILCMFYVKILGMSSHGLSGDILLECISMYTTIYEQYSRAGQPRNRSLWHARWSRNRQVQQH